MDYENSGGADAFLAVIEKQIIPFIENRFDVSQSDRVLIGKSMSGLAVVHTALSKPELFNRYLIISPSIWWDDSDKEIHIAAVSGFVTRHRPE